MNWIDARKKSPPDEDFGLVVLVTLTCDCAKGAQVALPAGRSGGEWVIGDFAHTYEIEYWLRLPVFPQRPVIH